jgi:hypothetical protein
MGKPVTSSTAAKQTKQDRRRDRREEQRKREEERLRAAKRNRMVLGVSILVVVLVVAASVYFFSMKTPGSSSTTTASAQSNNAAYPPVDNIVCETNEQGNYHVHAHLTLYINGQQVAIPQNIGIAGDQSCLYWLHTHDTSGVIHVEAPNQQVFTLGTFFKEWSQVFPQQQYPVQLSSTDGWKVYVNGKPYTGDFHKIELSAHTLITMAYQSPNVAPDTVYNWGDL